MITRVIQKKRPRGSAALAIGATALAVLGLVVAVAVAALVSDTGTYDITVADKNHSSNVLTLSPSGGSVEYIGSSAQNQASGTGLFDPFVRLQGSPTEKGYNTNGAVAFDTKSGTWTHAIKVDAIPLVDCDGGGPGIATCWEIFNDINESNTAKRISLNVVEVWFTTNPNLVGYVDPTGFPSGAAKEYEFNGDILINDVNQGSGRGDLRYLIPTAGHTWTGDTYFVLYSKWGTTPASQTATNGTGAWGSDGGFEEWKVRKTPNLHIVKTANPAGPVSAGTDIGFDITISNTGAADATNVTISDPLPAGSDLNWSLSPAFSGCSITGSVGSQTLNCSFATLAAGASIGPIHVTSATTKDDCATVHNVATVDSAETDPLTDDADVVVQCPDVSIVKTANPVGPVDAGDPIGFDVTLTNAGPGTATNVVVSDNLPAGGDLDWSLDPSFTGCAVNGSVGSQTLDCTFATFAPGTIGPIHLTSDTTQEDCADVTNTASFTSDNDGSGNDDATVTVNCAAILILKQSTKTTGDPPVHPLVQNAGAEFCIDSATGCTTTTVTDNGTGDEDTTTGSICVGGLQPGTYYVNETAAPDGYGSSSDGEQTVVAVQGTNCSTNLPVGTAVATFTDPPLSDIQVNFRDGGSGETSATITCDNTTGTQDTTAATGWDTTDTETGVSAPVTVTCTIVIDP